MRPFIPFAIVVFMSTFAASQTLLVPQAITDPKQITSKPNAQCLILFPPVRVSDRTFRFGEWNRSPSFIGVPRLSEAAPMP